MKTMLTKCYIWPCLCLLICSSFFSCALQWGINKSSLSVLTQEQCLTLQVKIRLLPGFNSQDLPLCGLQNIASVHDAVINYSQNDSNEFILKYHFTIKGERDSVVAQLLTSGTINIISITKTPN